MTSDLFIFLILVLLQTQVNMFVFLYPSWFINQVNNYLVFLWLLIINYSIIIIKKPVNEHVNTHTIPFLQQLLKSQNMYCQEAVDSVKIVTSCPTSKTEWDAAAKRKNCNIIAQHQNCVSGQNFKYHCVINGLRNNLIEVCAPARIIFGI